MLRKLALLTTACLAFTGQAQAMGEEPVTYTQTEAPIVLVNGLFGWDTIAGWDYWYGIVDDLEENGATVYVVNVQAAQSIAIRGEQLIADLESFSATDGHQDFNLIGHSYGAPTSRYVAATRPELVRSVSTVAGVNKGTDLADALYEFGENPDTGGVLWQLGNLVGLTMDGLSGHETPTDQDIRESARQMTYAGMEEWNQSFPQGVASDCGEGAHEVNGIRYYSWGGNVQRTSPWDPIDLIVDLAATFFDNDDHDGFVPRCSQHLGQVIRDDYPLNHLDVINQFTGLVGEDAPDPVQLFRNHANRMKNAGL